MADAVIANWDGHYYQARFFWVHASGLRNNETKCVVEVSYETDGPKGFDDVVVRYSPGKASRRPLPVETAHHQVKFHVTRAGRFGFRDLATPEFIGAEKFTVLQRLKDAVAKAPPNSTFTLITTDRVLDNDPLSKLIATADHGIDIGKLAVGKTARSEMGEVRALWREHLELDNDKQLFAILETFHIKEGYLSLDDMRTQVDLHFQIVGLSAGGNGLDFPRDGAARALKSAQRSVLTREGFEEFCREQGWIKSEQPDLRKSISIRSFTDGPTDYLDAAPENALAYASLHRPPSPAWRGLKRGRPSSRRGISRSRAGYRQEHSPFSSMRTLQWRFSLARHTSSVARQKRLISGPPGINGLAPWPSQLFDLAATYP